MRLHMYTSLPHLQVGRADEEAHARRGELGDEPEDLLDRPRDDAPLLNVGLGMVPLHRVGLGSGHRRHVCLERIVD